MKRVIPIFLLALFSVVTSSALEAKKTFVIATYDHDTPTLKIIEKKVFKMYDDAGIEYQVKRLTMARAIAEASAGRVDALLGHPEGTEHIIKGFEPIGSIIKTQKFAAFTTKKNSKSLKEFRIVVLRGMPYVEKALESLGIKFITHPEAETIAELLRKDRYDTTIMSVENADWGAQKVPGLHQVGDIIAEFPIVHYVSTRRADVIKKLKASTR